MVKIHSVEAHAYSGARRASEASAAGYVVVLAGGAGTEVSAAFSPPEPRPQRCGQR